MQQSLQASIIRGGTSRGLFLRLSDLPDPGTPRDQLLLELMGSPDPIQVDGLGGGHSHTSKVMAVDRSELPGVDIDYLFAQVDVRSSLVDYGGNCGNLTAAVGVYALDEGLVSPSGESPQTVVLRCLNTDSLIRVKIPVSRDGTALVNGDYQMAGVNHPGARIEVEYLDPSGAMFNRGPFPTGELVTTLPLPDGMRVDVSIVDITSPLIIAKSLDLGVGPPFNPEALNRDSALLELVETLRGECAALLGLTTEPGEARRITPGQPKVALCAPAADYETTAGETISGSSVDILATMVSVQRFHHAFAGTGALALASACRIPGTVAAEIAGAPGRSVRVGHPKGIAAATVDLGPADGPLTIEAVGVSRTARILMKGQVFHRDPHH